MNHGPHRLLSLLLALAMILSLLPAVSAASDLTEIPLSNGDFELGDATNWVLTGLPEYPVRTNQWNEPNTSWTLNLWASDTEQVEIHAAYSVDLNPGTYQFSFLLSGQGVDSSLKWTVKAGDEVLAQQADTVTTVDWNVWNTIETDEFTLTEATEVTFDFGGTAPAGYWGDLDDLKLYGRPDPVELGLPNGDFELGDYTNWVLTGFPEYPVRTNEWNEPNTSWTLNLWASDTEQVEIHAAYSVKLTAGTYQFSFLLSGQGVDSNLKWTVKAGDEVLVQQADTVTTVDWNVWNTIETDEFTLTETTEVTFDFGGTAPAGYWGDLDDLKLYGTGTLADTAPDREPEIYVPKVEGIDGDFMRGTDVSSFLSIYNSGATFYDFEGNALDQQGFFDLLADSGYNYVRLRLWNDPFDADGNGYGGGNCDINAVLAMGQWATNAGLRVLVDFHYSDFWADPGKQKVPKAWSGFTADQKAEALEAFTYNSLKTLLDGGVDVGMVQIGNETTGSICGESSWTNKAKLFSAGSAATRQISEEYDHPILVSIHFTNPERSGNYASQAKNLNDYGVDYDIFASSWYPFWHGTLENLTSVLKDVADTYGKQVVVTETSWAWTLEDGDGHDNTVRTGNNDGSYGFEFSVQGQADELVAVTEAVKDVGDAGLGVFYWENAWIPVQYAFDEEGNLDEDILASNKEKWEAFGSGWASSYASEYDPNDAGVWYGGSACDNQAQFDFEGHPLDSLNTWRYMMSGEADTVELAVVSVEQPALTYELGDTLALPETVTVTYNVGGSEKLPVVWDAEAVAQVDMNTPGVYLVNGTVTTACGDYDTLCTITVNYPNLLLNPGFEESDMSMYTLTGGMKRRSDNPLNGSYGLGFYNSSAVNVSATQDVTLEPGDYTFSLNAMGGNMGDAQDNYIFVRIPTVEGSTELTDAFILTAWNDWKHPAVNFTLEETATVTVGVQLTGAGGGWGDTDDWNLCKALEEKCTHENTEIRDAVEPTCTEPGYTGDKYCTVCGELIEEGTVTDALGHSETEIRDAADPTCTEPGYTGDKYCTVCGELIEEGTVTDALGHGKTEIRDAAEPTCTEPGYTGDTYCSICGEKVASGEAIEALGHNYEDGSCTVCGEEDPDFLPVNPFEDVKEADYFSTPVLWAVKNGITTGTTPTSFSPDEPCTRGQVVTFLWRASGSPEPTTTENPFTDVPENVYYYKAVLWAVELGITTGVSATEFAPEETCTRGQVATFLWRACGKPAPTGSSEAFSDVPKTVYYYEPILWAAENSITNGTGGGNFSPEDSCTRGQIVTFLYRALAE